METIASHFGYEYDDFTPIETIASYHKGKHMTAENFRVVKDEFIQIYKAKYPEEYKSRTEWLMEEWGKMKFYLLLSGLLLLGLFFSIFKFKSKYKRGTFIARTLLVFLILVFASLQYRYYYENKVEMRLMNELAFVSNHLVNDTTYKPYWSHDELKTKMALYYSSIVSLDDIRPRSFWLSRWIDNSWLKYLFPNRVIRGFYKRIIYRAPVQNIPDSADVYTPDTILIK